MGWSRDAGSESFIGDMALAACSPIWIPSHNSHPSDPKHWLAGDSAQLGSQTGDPALGTIRHLFWLVNHP